VFTGHYSASFAGKAVDRTIPLWVLFVAVQLLDFVWAILVLLGIEKVRIVPGFMAASALDLYYMPYTTALPVRWFCRPSAAFFSGCGTIQWALA
jgi:hypothetical protein